MTEIIAKKDIQVIEEEINFYKKQTSIGIIEIGKRLIQAKEMLSHGEWGSWLEEKVEFSIYTASRFMKVANEFPNLPTSANMTISKAFELLALPTETRQEFISNNEISEITVRELRDEIAKLKAETKEPTVIEKVVEKNVVHPDYYKTKKRLEDLEIQYEDLKFKKESLEKKAKLNQEQSDRYECLQSDISKLAKEKTDLSRQIEASSELSKLVVKVDSFIKNELSPVKYSRAIRELKNDDIVQRNLAEIVASVEAWCMEMRGILEKGDVIDV